MDTRKHIIRPSLSASTCSTSLALDSRFALRATTGLAAVLSLVLGCEGEMAEPETENQALDSVPESAQIETATSDTLRPGRVNIPMRVFSTSPTLGAKSTSVSQPWSRNYGALKVFFDKAAAYTRNTVSFSTASWSADSNKTVIQQVGTNNDPATDGVARDAAYDSGAALNPVWGFMFNSIPFGPNFELMRRYLYDEGGLKLAQELVDARGLNVKILPVVGSNPQGSGYFKHPIGQADCDGELDCHRETPIGLAGLCTAGWTWRYYGQGLEIIKRACGHLQDEGRVGSLNVNPGVTILGQSTLTDVQKGNITAFEYATPLDDYDPPPAGAGNFPPLTHGRIPQTSQNPGHKGLRFLHSPGWHQGFYIGWLMVNKTTVWDRLSPAQRRAVDAAARDALEESYWFSWTRQCDAIKKILDHNNGQVQLDDNGNPILVNGHRVSADIKLASWPSDALHRLEQASVEYLDSLKGGAEPSLDQQEYTRVLNAYRRFVSKARYHWDARAFDYAKACHVD